MTVETRVGEVYRGVLDEAEDNMNLILKVRSVVGRRNGRRDGLDWLDD